MEKHSSKPEVKKQSRLMRFISKHRGLIFVGALLGAAQGCATFPTVNPETAAAQAHAAEQKARKASPYGALTRDFNKDLDPGDPDGTDLEGALSKLPVLYYDNKVELDPEKPTNSVILALAKVSMKEVLDAKKRTEERQFILEQLYTAAQPGRSDQQTMKDVYYDNGVANKELMEYWPELQLI